MPSYLCMGRRRCAGILRVPSQAFRRLLLLVIDNFDEQTDESEAFVKKLPQDPSDTDVFVFILTRNQAFATSLVELNGGLKIKPLFGNVDNSNYERERVRSKDRPSGTTCRGVRRLH